MKKLILSIVAVLAFSFASSAQCGEDLMKTALNAMGSCQYIKDFDIKLPAGSADGITYNVILNSRTMYQLNIANGSANSENVVVELYNNADGKVGTNLNNGKVFTGCFLKIMKTGAYKLHVYTQNGSEACARAVLSLKELIKE